MPAAQFLEVDPRFSPRLVHCSRSLTDYPYVRARGERSVNLPPVHAHFPNPRTLSSTPVTVSGSDGAISNRIRLRQFCQYRRKDLLSSIQPTLRPGEGDRLSASDMGNNISRTAAQSRLSKALPTVQRERLVDDDNTDAAAAAFQSDIERQRLIGEQSGRNQRISERNADGLNRLHLRSCLSERPIQT